MPAPLNAEQQAAQQLADLILRHEIALSRYAGGFSNRVLAVLKEAEAAMAEAVARRLGWIAQRGYDASPFTLRRLEANLAEIRTLIAEAYRKAGALTLTEMRELAQREAKWAARSLGVASLGVTELGVGLPLSSLLAKIVTSQPIQGSLLKGWIARLSGNEIKRFEGAIRKGMLNGDSIQEIVRDLFGRKGGPPGALSAWRRREVEAWSRTAVSTIANSAREETWKENSDIVTGYQWVSTLDSRTTPECQIRDGLEYDLNYEPIGHSVPWEAGPGALHFNCRSTSIPLIGGKGIPRTTFGEWIGKQPYETQVDALGRGRADLLRSGEVTFSKLYTSSGDMRTLDQLYRMVA